MILKTTARICILLLLIGTVQNNLWASTTVVNDLGNNEPQVWYGEEVDVKPTASTKQIGKRSWLSKNKWWVALGAALICGIAVSGGGGGGSKSDGTDPSESADTGTYVNEW